MKTDIPSWLICLIIIAFIFALIVYLVPYRINIQNEPENRLESQLEGILATLPLPLLRVAFCESSFNLEAVNINNNGSRDFGILQVNSIHKPQAEKLGIDIETPEGSIEFALILYEEQGLKPWRASEKCHQLTIRENE